MPLLMTGVVCTGTVGLAGVLGDEGVVAGGLTGVAGGTVETGLTGAGGAETVRWTVAAASALVVPSEPVQEKESLPP